MNAPTLPDAVKPSRSDRARWWFMTWLGAALAALGVWASWFDPASRQGGPLIAMALGIWALVTAQRIWWLLETLTKALEKTTAGFQQALHVTESPVRAPEGAAERLAAPGEGSGHPGPAERLSGPEVAG